MSCRSRRPRIVHVVRRVASGSSFETPTLAGSSSDSQSDAPSLVSAVPGRSARASRISASSCSRVATPRRSLAEKRLNYLSPESIIRTLLRMSCALNVNEGTSDGSTCNEIRARLESKAHREHLRRGRYLKSEGQEDGSSTSSFGR